MIILSIEEFAAKRRGDQDDLEKDLFPHVHQAIQAYPVEGWYNDLLAEVARMYLSVFHAEGGQGEPDPSAAEFTAEVRATLDKTEDPTKATVDRISVWLATAILNAATQAAAATDDEEFLLLEWVTMHDSDVRPEHKAAEGQTRPPGEPYLVGGSEMRYPGDPTAPINLWINCRCTLAPTLGSEADFNTEGVKMTATEQEQVAEAPVGPLQWHGVLAPEGVWSGDGRRFAEGALRFRDLPIPLTWQKSTEAGHDGSVVVAKIEKIERVGNLMHGSGSFLATPEADEVVGLIAEFGKFGVSVDADDAEFEFNEGDDEGKVTFTSARIASASVVSIPAFAEAFVALGPWTEEEAVDSDEAEEECDPNSPDYEECLAKKEQVDKGDGPTEATQTGTAPKYMQVPASITYNGPIPNHTHASMWTTSSSGTWNGLAVYDQFVSEKSWDGSAGRFTPEQWKRSCILHVCDGMEKSCHKLPIREPGGALSRAGVHAAASRFGQVDAPAEAKAKAKSALRGAYQQLGEEIPDALKATADTERFDRGKGWITHPKETKRIHDYWTRPGEEGFIKIGWGKGGDFARCKALVGEKIAANSPEDLRHLNEICARWHHDALGIWPGEHKAAVDTLPFDTEKVGGPSVGLVASAGQKAPAEWFTNPNLAAPTHLTITEEGRVFGHIAQWGVCHIGFEGVCVEPPHSATDYGYFATGRVLLDDNSFARTGVISAGGGHAPQRASIRAAIAHYDSTSTAVADVAVGEDDHGIWCAGWVRPGVTDEQVIALRASDVSGDWRETRPDQMELVAALGVNVGGFPTAVGIEDGVQISLVAAGMVHYQSDNDEVTERLAEMIEARIVERETRRNRMKALRDKVGGNGGV